MSVFSYLRRKKIKISYRPDNTRDIFLSIFVVLSVHHRRCGLNESLDSSNDQTDQDVHESKTCENIIDYVWIDYQKSDNQAIIGNICSFKKIF